MKFRSAARQPGRKRVQRPGVDAIAGALLSLAFAVALYTRFGIDDSLRRDEAIYAYAGQQLTHGVPPYVSIFDPKTPLAALLAGLGAAVGDLVGVADLSAMRATFFVFACLTLLSVYLLTLQLWRSPLAGFVAATVFASFRGFAMDALAGPNAKTPGIFFAVLSLALAIRRRWFLAGAAGSLGFLVWQPLLLYAAAAVAAAAVSADPGQRRKALGLAAAGAALPVVLTAAYFAVAGALDELVEAAFVFPVEGLRREAQTPGERLKHIGDVALSGYRQSSHLFWVGLLLLLGLCAHHLRSNRAQLRRAVTDPLIYLVLTTLLVMAAVSVADFQGYPDLYPLLPYAALGFGGTAAWILDRLPDPALRRKAVAGGVLAVTALTALSWWWFSDDPEADGGLVAQRRAACGLEQVIGPEGTLRALADPTPLVLTHRRNPDRFVYLASGVGRWHADHTPGRYAGWGSQIESEHPTAIVVQFPLKGPLATWLQQRSGYEPARLHGWDVFLAPGVLLRPESDTRRC